MARAPRASTSRSATGSPRTRTPRWLTTRRSARSAPRDIQRVLRGQQRTFAALNADEGALQELITNFNTAEAFAVQDAAILLRPGAARCPSRCAAGAGLAQQRAAVDPGRSPSTRCRRPVPRRRRSARPHSPGAPADAPLGAARPRGRAASTAEYLVRLMQRRSGADRGAGAIRVHERGPGPVHPLADPGRAGPRRGARQLGPAGALPDTARFRGPLGREPACPTATTSSSTSAVPAPAPASSRRLREIDQPPPRRTCPATRPRSRPTSARRGAGVAAWQRQPPPRLGDHPLEGQAAHPCGAQPATAAWPQQGHPARAQEGEEARR